MTREQIISIIKSEITEEFEVEESIIQPDAEIYETLQLDSLSLVDLVSIVHTQFKIRMSKEDVHGIKTFNDLYDYIESHIEH